MLRRNVSADVRAGVGFLPHPLPGQSPIGQLVVFNAGSLAKPFSELLSRVQRQESRE